MINKLKILLTPYSSILFLRDFRVGVTLFLLTFLLPSVGFLGLVAILSVVLFAEATGMREEYLKYGFYLYNSLLVGMGIGFYFDISIDTTILSVVFSILTFLISFSLNRVFLKYSLPILSLPFAIVSMIFYLATLKYNYLLTNILHRTPLFDINLDNLQFFKSLGTIFFLPYNFAGIVISIIILLYSRILFFMAITGFYVGVLFHSIFVPFQNSINSFYNFNYIIIAMAIGGVFFVANIRSYLLAYLSVILSVIIIDAMQVFLNIYLLPVYTLPFNGIVLLVIMTLYYYKYVNLNIKDTPEKSLENYLSSVYRFGGNDIKINCPFSGEWNVYQSFNGKWTHKGDWKYAVDFVKKQNEKTYKNDGLYLEDYFAYAQNVLAPVSGYIYSMRMDLEDNFIGNVDRVNNWGNYIIINSNGVFVLIAHLMKNSSLYTIGNYVNSGDIIAKCGNSGYSPEPHIHLQVQEYGVLGSKTIPFKFTDYLYKDKLVTYSIPKEGENIKALLLDKSMLLRLNFILDDKYKYEIFENSKKIAEIEFIVKMNDKGEFYFQDDKENKLYFNRYEKMFYFYNYEGKHSILLELFKVIPKIPLIIQDIEYRDILPVYTLFRGVKLYYKQFMVSFSNTFFNKSVKYQKKQLSINSKYGEATLSVYEKGFETIKFNNIQLRRVYEKDIS